ncbi:helix-turn-helix domain-containing protein [Paenibacillus tarimensis]
MVQKIAQMVRKRALMLKMGLSYALIACLLLSLFSVVLARRVTDDLTEEIRRNAEKNVYQSYSTADLLITNAYQYFYQIFNKDEIVSEAMYRQGLDRIAKGKVYRRLSDLLEINPLVHSIYIYNFQDDIVFSTLSPAQSIEGFYDKGMTKLVKDEAERGNGSLLPRNASFNIYDQAYDMNLISIIYSDSDPDSYSHGVLIVNLDQQVLQRLVSDDNEQASSTMTIIDRQGTIISHPDGDSINRNIGREPHIEAVLESTSKQGRFFDTVNGKKTLITYVKSDRLGWSFVSLSDYDGLIGKANLLQRFIFVITAAFGLIGLAAGGFFTNRFYQPLRQLTRKVRTTMEGMPEEKSALGEYELLSHSFDSLTGRLSRLKSELNQHLPDAKKAVLLSMCRGEWRRDAESESRRDRLGLRLREDNLRACVIRLDRYPELMDQYGMKGLSLLKYAVVNIVEEIVNSQAFGEVAEDGEDSVTVIFCEEDSDAGTMLEEIQRHIQSYLKFSVTIGIGIRAARFEELEHSWNTASQAANNRLVHGRGKVLRYEEIHRQAAAYDYPLQTERKIVDALKAGDLTKLELAFGEFTSFIREGRYDEILLALNQLMVITLRASIEMVDDPSGEWMMELQDAHNKLRWHDTLEDISAWYIALCARIVEIRDRKAASRGAEQIDELISLIEERYGDPNLSVASLAEAVGWSTNYARKMFKDHTGRSASQYINELRFRKAQELLRETDLPANRIGELVGMTNPSYFYVAFKKFSGKTPDNYRKACAAEERIHLPG